MRLCGMIANDGNGNSTTITECTEMRRAHRGTASRRRRSAITCFSDGMLNSSREVVVTGLPCEPGATPCALCMLGCLCALRTMQPD